MHRRCRNRITRLQSSDGIWLEDEDQIGSSFAQFYSDLFTSLSDRNFADVLECVEPLITQQDNSRLMQDITSAEVKTAVFDLGSNKAPGPDGFTGAFYQNAWAIVGDQVCSLIQSFFNTGFPLADINNTDLVLISKKDCPESVSDYRPISLCNFSYKVFSKVLANRLKPFLHTLITENQEDLFRIILSLCMNSSIIRKIRDLVLVN